MDGLVTGAGDLVARLAGRWRRFQNGLVRSYAIGVLTSAVLLLAFLVFPRHQIAPRVRRLSPCC